MRKIVLAAALAWPLFSGAATAQETVKIGYIDPLSGGGASIGEVGLKTYQFLADELNAKGGILGKKVEIVPLDNKTNPQESLIQAQKAIDSGVRYLTQGNGSAVAAALSDFAQAMLAVARYSCWLYYRTTRGAASAGNCCRMWSRASSVLPATSS